MKLLSETARVCLALIFLFAAGAKLVSPDAFSRQVATLFGDLGLHALAANDIALMMIVGIVVIAEAAIGIVLLLNYRADRVLPLTALMVLVFLVINMTRLQSTPNADCGCFGDLLQVSYYHTFLLDLAMLALTLFLMKVEEVGALVSEV